MKYLHYKTLTKTGQGLMDKRSCLMFLLAEAKLSKRVAVIPKFVLGAQHNNGNNVETYMINIYFNIDRLDIEYVLEENFLEIENTINENDILNIKDEEFDYDSDKSLVRRNLLCDDFWSLKKLYDVIHLAKLYHGVGVKYIIPLITVTDEIKSIGDKILNQLEKPVIGLHLRRGDRLNKRLRNSMNQKTIINKFNSFNYNSVFYCSNDQGYKIEDNRYYSNKNFSDLLKPIKDNFLLFCIEMYVVDNSDISVRTFNDSSPFYYIEDKTNKNYSISDYSMHGSDSRFKNIPKELVKCSYEDYEKDTRKTFIKPLTGLPLVLSKIKRVKNSLEYRIKHASLFNRITILSIIFLS